MMNPPRVTKQPQTISLGQRELVDRFIAAYNSIEQHLRSFAKGKLGFRVVVEKCVELGHIRSVDAQTLIRFANLRNVLVHEPTQARLYPAIPTIFTVEQFERLRESLLRPEQVVPRYEKDVEVVSISDSLPSVLRIISQRDYSQFPVYDDRVFKGLLTENGITRWLAHHIDSKGARAALNEALVRHALREEEHKRINFRFISRHTTINQLKSLFAKHELLEAALITQNGKNSETLMGIVTRWDILQLA